MRRRAPRAASAKTPREQRARALADEAETPLLPPHLFTSYLDAGENAAHVWADMRAAEDEAAARAVAGKFARALIIALALETDALEREVRAAHPEFRYIDLEVM